MTDDLLSRWILISAAITGGLGVAIGAFGAHGLENALAAMPYEPEVLQRRLAQFDTGVRYHLIHAVALLALASMSIGNAQTRQWIARFFVLGILLFSGSLYLLVLSGQTKLGMVTPLGGLSWIIGWFALIPLAMQRTQES